jgi:hypothetical protein
MLSTTPHPTRRGRKVALLALVVSALVVATGASASNLEGGKHWYRGATAVAQVYFVDHTGVRWPVNASVIKWNEASRLGAYYSNPGTCPFHCVQVYEGNYGSGWYGLTTLSVDANKHFIAGNMKIQLNNSLSTTQNQRQSIACQEEGHAIGIDHQSATNSCMYPTAAYFPLYPNGHDFDMVYTLYDHQG